MHGLKYVDCPLCGMNDPVMVKLGTEGRECGKCGMYYRNRINANLKEFYSSGEFDRTLRDEDDGYFISGAKLRIGKLGKALDVGSVLDIGCGAGHFLDMLDVPVVDGIDPTTERFISGFFPEDMPEAKFDLITMFHVIEHQENPVHFLSSTLDFLNDGGHIVVEYPDVDRRLLRDSTTMEMVFDNRSHLCEFTSDTMERLFAKSGYEVVEKMYMGDNIPEDKNVMVIGRKTC